MTLPITPNPGVHQAPVQVVQQQQFATPPQLNTWADQLVEAFTLNVINSILNGLGLGSYTSGVDQALIDLETALAATVADASGASADWNTFLTDLGLPTPADVVTWLNTQLSNLVTDAQNIIDGLINGLGGSGSTVADMTAAIEAIPFANVLGLLGLSNLGESIAGVVDGIWQALTGESTTGNSIANLSSAAAAVTAVSQNAQTLGEVNSGTLANYAVTKPSYLGVDASADSVFPISQISGTSPTTISVGPTGSVIGFIATPDGGVKKSIIWLGSGTTGLTAFYLAVYSVNTSTGALTQLFTSANIIGAVGNSLGWNYYDFSTADYVTTAQGNWFAVEMMVEGGAANSYTLAGIPNHWLPTNANVYPQAMAASRTSLPSVTYDATGAGADTHSQTTSPQTITWSHTATAGAYVIAAVNASLSTSNGISSITASYGGTSMTQLGSVKQDNQNGGLVALFGLANVAGGAKTVSTTATAVSGGVAAVTGGSVSYLNVGSVGTVSTTFSTGTSLSESATGVAEGLVVQAFGMEHTAATVSLSAYNQTQRYLHNAATVNDGPLVIGDSATVGAISFTATLSNGTNYGGITAVLQPAYVLPPSTISSPTYSGNVPWLALGGSAGVSAHAPLLTEYSVAGTDTYSIPVWATFFDVIVLGGGGGGSYTGTGGAAGAWNAVTLTAGTSFPGTTTTMAVTVGAGGTGGTSGVTLGTSGAASSVVVTGYGTVSGGGGLHSGGGSGNGQSPGNEVFDAITYFGGATQSTLGGAGQAPGGGGASGSAGSNGGAGAPGAVWILAYQ